MNTTRRAVLLGSVGALVAGCATGRIVTGPYRPGGTFSVTLGRQWSDITMMVPNRPPNVKMLSVDGPLLNRLYLISGLAEGESIVRPADRDTPRPTYRADMSDAELVEFLIDCIAQEYQAPQSSALRPQNMGNVPGVRFDIATHTSAGLDISGTGLVARVAGKFNAIYYLAPSEYYYAQLLPDVEAIMASATV